MALLTILVTAFLITARTEFTSSNFYAKGVSTKLLSENVINLVMAQLLEGARSTDVNTSAPQAWASQPGMIRTYDAMGNPYKFFKLYSWDNMVGSGPFDETRMAEIPPNDWSTQTNVFTDLNEPVNATYPILDPGAQNNVEGFSLNLPTGFTTTTNPLPMPVKWLYVLKNGTLTVGTPTGTGAAVHITNASTTNPIIGRVAFWTDDETSKVNINTASEGIFWDQPYGNDTNEMGVHNASGAPPFGFAESIPNASEFARIPGHPATTSLSAVFGYGSNPILPDTSFSASDPNGLTWPLTVDTYTSAFGPYYSLTPRYQAGGTMGGAQYAPQTFSLPGYRLYDSVDELAFDPGRMPLTSDNNALYPAANGASPPGRSTLPALTPSVIQQRRFFLTAHSQAPEETLFGTPRISLWPLQDGTQTLVPRTAKDNLLAFCSTINGQPYYFQRAGFYQYQAESGGPVINSPTTIPSALSATEDFPGAPTSTPQTGVARNENLYAYLQALTGGATGNSNVPGFGGNFYLKYPGANDSTGTLVSDRDEILTQMFDLIRSGTNTFNTSPNVLPHYVYTPGKANAVDNPYGGPIDPGEAIPISIPSNHTHGLGRTYNFGDVSIVFFAQGMALNNGVAATKTTPAIPPLPAGTPAPAPNGNLMSIGPELPWAVAIDTNDLFTAPPYQKSPTIPGPCWLYWDTATGKYGAYVYEPTGTTTNSPALVAINPATNKPQVDSNNKYVPLVSSGGTIVTIADPQTTAVQAYVLLNPHSVVQGVPAFAPNLRVRVSNLDQMAISINGGGSTPMGFPAGSEAVVCYNNQNNATTDSMGGLLTPFNWQQPFDTWSGGLGGNVISSNTTSPNSYNNDGTNPYNYNYPLVSASVELASAAYPSAYGGEDQSEISQPLVANPPTPVQIHLLEPTNTGTTNTMTTTAVTLKIDVFDAYTDLTSSTAAPFQTFYVKIPTLTLPIPTIEMANQEGEALGGAGYNPASSSNNTVGPRIPGYVATNPSSLGFPVNSPNLVFNVVPSGTPPGSPFPIYGTYYIPGYPGLLYNNTAFGATTAEPQDPQPGVLQPLNYYWQQPWDVRSVSQRFSPWWSQSYGRVFTVPTTGRLICHGDVVRTFVLNPTPGSIDGDVRLLGANPIRSAPSGNTPVVATDDFIPLGDGNPAGYSNFPTQGPYTSVYIRQLHSMSFDNGSQLRVLLNLFPTSQAVLQAVPFVRDAWGNAINGPIGFIAPGNGGIGQTSGALFAGEEYADSTTPNVTPELQGAFMDAASQIAGDWTLGQGPTADGPFIQKPDEGLQPPGSTVFPYYSTSIGNNALNTVNISYSPSREIASAIAFGSLPSRAMQGIPWCTLLFCPNPAANDNGQVSADLVHPGFGTAGATSLGTTNDPAYFNPPYTLPPDHLFLDLFWMPVVEPYAISEPFSTAGKVNMNYEIVPFGGYIHRSTALHAVMKATQLIAVPTNYNNQNFVKATATAPPNSGLNFGGAYPSFKAISFFYEDSTWEGGSPFDFAARYGINLSATIDDTASAFYQRFNVLHDIFRSASEICNVFLVPQTIPGLNYSPTAPAVPTNASYNSMQSWWANFKLTGDNGREDPYNQLYPRLTTKSNTFEVHMRVQVLSQSPADRGSGNFDLTAGDSIVGEYRGSAIVERYLDPNQTTLPDFATTFPVNPTGPTSTVDNYIHYRVVSTQAFSP